MAPLLDTTGITTLHFTNGDGIQPTLTESPPGEVNVTYNFDASDVAGAGLEDDGSENLRIAASAAGAGLTGGGGSALAVGAGDGIDVNANDVAVDASDLAGEGLEDDGSNNLAVISVPLDHRYVTLVDEFLSCSGASAIGTTPVPVHCDTTWWFVGTAGAASSIASSNGLDQHPGLVTMTTSAANGNGCILMKGLTKTSSVVPGGTADWSYEALVRLPTATNYCWRVGVSSDPEATNTNGMVIFESDSTINSGAIHGYYGAGVARTSAGSTTAPSTNWVRLRCTKVNTTLTWYVNGTQSASFTGVGVPSGGMNFFAFVFSRTTATRQLVLDRLGIKMGPFGARV